MNEVKALKQTCRRTKDDVIWRCQNIIKGAYIRLGVAANIVARATLMNVPAGSLLAR